MNLDRFKSPIASDELADCQGVCGQRFHYTALNESGLCLECRPDKTVEEISQSEQIIVDSPIPICNNTNVSTNYELMNAELEPLKVATAYAQVFDRLLQSIMEPPRICMDCRRPLPQRGLCDDCRAVREQDEIEQARAVGNY